MTKFVVHIGDGKCGSSAIQASLFDARNELMKAGVAYDSHHRPSGNYNFGTLLGKRTRGNDAHQRMLASEVIERIRSKLTDVEYVIISSEAFLTMEPEEVIQILSLISDNIESVDAVAYVRNPISMYLSFVQQSLKASFRFVKPDAYRRPVEKFVHKWNSNPNINSVTVRLFDRSALIENNAVADFEAILRRLTGRPSLSLEHLDENTSLSAEQMVILQYYRFRLHPDHNNRRSPDTSRLLEFFESMNAQGMVGTKPQLTADAAAWITHSNRETITWLNEACGMRTELLPSVEVALPSAQEWAKVSSILEVINPKTIHHLKMMIPAFNNAIAQGDTAKAWSSFAKLKIEDPARAQAVKNAAEIYWSVEAEAKLNRKISA